MQMTCTTINYNPCNRDYFIQCNKEEYEAFPLKLYNKLGKLTTGRN